MHSKVHIYSLNTHNSYSTLEAGKGAREREGTKGSGERGDTKWAGERGGKKFFRYGVGTQLMLAASSSSAQALLEDSARRCLNAEEMAALTDRLKEVRHYCVHMWSHVTCTVSTCGVM